MKNFISQEDFEKLKNNGFNANPVIGFLYQDAFEFFREKYGLLHSILEYSSNHKDKKGPEFSWIIRDLNDNERIWTQENNKQFSGYSYDDAQELCLKKLISLARL